MVPPTERVLDRRVELGVECLVLRVEVVHGKGAAQLLLVAGELCPEEVGPEQPLGSAGFLAVVQVGQGESTEDVSHWVEV